MEDKKVVEGYVFECEGHGFLGEYFIWHPSKKKPEERYVFPSGMLEEIMQKSRDWKFRPTKIYPAQWSEEDGVVIKGEPRLVYPG